MGKRVLIMVVVLFCAGAASADEYDAHEQNAEGCFKRYLLTSSPILNNNDLTVNGVRKCQAWVDRWHEAYMEFRCKEGTPAECDKAAMVKLWYQLMHITVDWKAQGKIGSDR